MELAGHIKQLIKLSQSDEKSAITLTAGKQYGKTTAQRFLEAREVSKLSPHPKFKMGCVINTRKGEIIAGYNQIKTHPKSTAPFNMLHAEIDTILEALKQEYDLEGATIYIYRETKNGNFAMAKPCDGCMIAIKKMKISNVLFTTNGGIECLSL